MEVVQYLVEKGTTVTDQNNLALIYATLGYNLRVVNFLLEYGARDQDYKALTELIKNKEEEEKDKETIIKRLLEYYYPREVIENLLTKVSNTINLLEDYLNQKFLISPQDQKLLSR